MMKAGIVVLTVSLFANCHAFWWPSSSSTQDKPEADESEPVAATSRQMPIGYFRTYFQPYFAHPSAYSSYYSYDPYMNWPSDYFLPATPNMPTTHKSTISYARPSPLSFQSLFNSLSATASNLLSESVPMRSTTTSTTSLPQPTTVSSTSTTTTPPTPAPTTEMPTTSALPNSVDHIVPLIVNRHDLGDSRHSEIPSQSSRVSNLNRRIDMPSSSNRQAYIAPATDALLQQYFASMLAAPHMHVVPCTCSMPMAVAPMTAWPEFFSPTSRSEDMEDAESGTIDSVIEEQPLNNKLIE